VYNTSVLNLEPDLIKVVLDRKEDTYRLVHGRLDSLHAAHELLRQTLIPKRRCARSKVAVVVVEDILADRRFQKMVEWVQPQDLCPCIRTCGPGSTSQSDVWPPLIPARRYLV